MTTTLHDACGVPGNASQILELLKHGSDDVKKKCKNGRLPIHVACENKQSKEVIDALIKAYPDGLQVQDKEGRLPIHVACEKEHSEATIAALVEAHQEGLEVKDKKGRLPIHVACLMAEQRFEVIDVLMNAYPDGLQIYDYQRLLPIHHACHARGKRGYNDEEDFEVIGAILNVYSKNIRVVEPSYILDVENGYSILHHACIKKRRSFSLIKDLIRMCPEALCKKSKTNGRTPFGWDYKESRGGHFKEFIQHLITAWGSLPQVDAGKEDPDDRPQVDVENLNQGSLSVEEDSHQYHRIITHCKDFVPLDILEIGFLNEMTLEKRCFRRWLNGILCSRSMIFVMVFKFYCHIAWIYTFANASYLYYVESDAKLGLGWRPTALIFFAVHFLWSEIAQFTRYYFTGASLYYCTDLWNWLDLVTSVMVIVSAVRFRDEDSDIAGRLLMTTGCLQSLLFLSYLKKTFYSFSKFVSGVIRIVWAVIPFLVVSGVTLFTYSFMYFVQEQDQNKNISGLENKTADIVPLEDAAVDESFASLLPSFQTVFEKFAGGAKESLSALDFFFGIIVVIVLLNVIIAVVSDEWAKADEEANASFWKYRLDLIIDETRGLRFFLRKYSSVYYRFIYFMRMIGDLIGIPRDIPSRETLLDMTLDFNAYNSGSHYYLDDTFLNEKTTGTTMEDFKKELAVQIKERGLVAGTKLFMECFLFFVLGFPTMGLLWPKFMREILFTSEEMEREIMTAKEGGSLSKTELDESLAEYKKTVSELSQKVSAQNDLLEQLLKKVS